MSRRLGRTPEEVFTPGSFPRHTYISRTDRDFEGQLRDALAVPGQITSIIGPSKSGKTVLVERVVGESRVLTITGGRLANPDDLAREVLDRLGAPSSTSTARTTGNTVKAAAEAGGELGIPLVAKGAAKATGEFSSARERKVQEDRDRRGLAEVLERLKGRDDVILLDDFHYVPRPVQRDLARELKECARRGMRLCLAAVPHRSEDVIRANADLRGRVAAIDIGFWSVDDLEKIALQGFELLNVELDPSVTRTFAVEASGSPQLMQAICLMACREMNLAEGLAARRRIDLDDDAVIAILRRTATLADRRYLVTSLLAGPKERGTARLLHPLRDGREGDVYACVVHAIAEDPPLMNLGYSELKRRIDDLCEGQGPKGAAVVSCIVNMCEIARVLEPDEQTIEWDPEQRVFTIVDPYLLFFVRWSRG